MHYIGIDLHKKTISVCVIDQQGERLQERNLSCNQPARIQSFFEQWLPYQAVVEATSSYEWLWQLLEPSANRLVLGHPAKMRVIAESVCKSDRLDARVLAEFLAWGRIPQAYRPTPREQQHRSLVRQRHYLSGRCTAVRNKIRWVLARYNQDRPNLFSAAGLKHLAAVRLREADRFVVEQLLAEWQHHHAQLRAVEKHLQEFAGQAPAVEQEARAVLASIPGVGRVTVDIMLSELGDIRRFRNARQVAAYAGLAPGQRASAGRVRDLGITKRGSPLLRWALVQAAWRLVRLSRRWRTVFERLSTRAGKKRAIVAVARRLLGVMTSLLRSGQAYQPVLA